MPAPIPGLPYEPLEPQGRHLPPARREASRCVVDATRWDDPRNEIVPLWQLEATERELLDRRAKREVLAFFAFVIIVGLAVLFGEQIEHAVRYAVGMLV